MTCHIDGFGLVGGERCEILLSPVREDVLVSFRANAKAVSTRLVVGFGDWRQQERFALVFGSDWLGIHKVLFFALFLGASSFAGGPAIFASDFSVLFRLEVLNLKPNLNVSHRLLTLLFKFRVSIVTVLLDLLFDHLVFVDLLLNLF